jgi:hypothetical protein
MGARTTRRADRRPDSAPGYWVRAGLPTRGRQYPQRATGRCRPFRARSRITLLAGGTQQPAWTDEKKLMRGQDYVYLQTTLEAVPRVYDAEGHLNGYWLLPSQL